VRCVTPRPPTVSPWFKASGSPASPNTEEEAVGLTKVVPFLVEDELKAKGGIFCKAADW
jgi:hypothetical protein